MKKTLLPTALIFMGITIGTSQAALIAISNSGFEGASVPGAGEFGFPGAEDWTGSSFATHAAFPRAGNGTLGDNFVFTTNASGPVEQTLADVFVADTDYTLGSFSAYNSGTVPDAVYTIGYDNGGGFTALNTATVTGTLTTWVENVGVTYSTGAAGLEIGQPIVVQIQSSNTGGLWLDNVTLDAVPEPSVAVLGAFGLLGLLRRRR